MIVGLGNPGADYRFNRHNVGAMALDSLAKAAHATAWQRKFHGCAARCVWGGEELLLLKPTTFMNLSGEAVGEALRYFKKDASAVVVVHDDIDLDPGKVKVKQGGGHAGHNGLRSLDSHIGKDYWRIRIGVGRPEHKTQVSDFVLSDFSKTDMAWVEPFLNAFPDALSHFLQGDQSRFATFGSTTSECEKKFQ